MAHLTLAVAGLSEQGEVVGQLTDKLLHLSQVRKAGVARRDGGKPVPGEEEKGKVAVENEGQETMKVRRQPCQDLPSLRDTIRNLGDEGENGSNGSLRGEIGMRSVCLSEAGEQLENPRETRTLRGSRSWGQVHTPWLSLEGWGGEEA